jgi:hypothetical protein
MSPAGGPWLGVAIAVLSSVVGTLGKQLLRFAELQRQSGGSLAGKAQFAGVLGQMILSPVLDIVALGFAPQTILAPFNGLSLVWNTILAVRAPRTALPACSAARWLRCVSDSADGSRTVAAAAAAVAATGCWHRQPFVLKESLSRSRVASCLVITAGMVINGMASSYETKAEHVRVPARTACFLFRTVTTVKATAHHVRRGSGTGRRAAG